MRNVDTNRAAEGPQPEDGTDGLYTSVVARRSRRRKQVVIGAVGLVAILGAGAAVTHQMRDDSATTAADTAADAAAPAPIAGEPAVDTAEPTAGPSASASAPAKHGPLRADPSTSASGTSTPKSTAERIKAAREAAAKDGVPVQRALPAPTGTAAAIAAAVTETRVQTAAGSLKVVSARHDLTGLRELAWVADKGEPVGDALCSNRIRLSPGKPAAARPTLLLCWKTSADRSVYTLAVNPTGTPSKRDSITALDKEWSRLS